MKRSLLSHGMCFVLGVVVMLALFYGGHGDLQNAVAQGGGGEAPVRNGDVNADGKLDVSDGIWIINHVFRGGPDPVPIVCPPTGLPATGQTTCYDNVGVVIDCASADYPGQDGAYRAGYSKADCYVDNEDGTVTDTCTGLQWQKGTAPGSYTWQGALKYCESLSLAGHDDWRLPNVRELESIVDYGRAAPAMDPVFGSDWGGYWSSSTNVGSPAYSSYVDFLFGEKYTDGKRFDHYVRAVRSGP